MSAANIAGGILGSLTIGFVGLPMLGLEASTRLTCALSLAGGIVAWAAFAPPRARPREFLYATPALILWLWIPSALHTRIPADFLHGGSALVDVREGMTSNVAVNRVDGVLQLKIDRWWQGENRRTHQIMAAYVPLAVHPAPRRVLVVGAGAGQTANRFLLGGVEKLDCVDIEPVVFDLIREHFDTGWLADPRVRLVRDDGRNFLMCTAERYDIISLELGQIFRPGVASFYTADFYAHARAHLAPGGVVCQFVPLRFLGTDQFPGVARTFLATFPHAILWYNTVEVMLLGSPDRSLRLNAARLEALLAEPRIRADLSWSPWGGRDQWLAQPHVFLAGMLCGEQGLESLAHGAPICRDDRPALEYAAARMDDTQALELPLVDLLARTLEPVSTVLEPPPSAELAALVSDARDQNLADLRCGAFLKASQEAQATRGQAGMVEALERALQANPKSRVARRMLGDVLVRLGRLSEARPLYDEALRLDPDDPLSLRGLGDWYLVQERVAEALELYRRVLAILPDDAQTHNNLGSCLAQMGDAAAAVPHFREALRLLPGAADPRRNLELLGVLESTPRTK